MQVRIPLPSLRGDIMTISSFVVKCVAGLIGVVLIIGLSFSAATLISINKVYSKVVI